MSKVTHQLKSFNLPQPHSQKSWSKINTIGKCALYYLTPFPKKCSLPPQPSHPTHPTTRQNSREKHKSGLWWFNQRPALHRVYFLSYWSQGLWSQTLLPGGCRPTQTRAWSSSLTSAAEPGAQTDFVPPTHVPGSLLQGGGSVCPD